MKTLSKCRLQLPRHGIREIMVRSEKFSDVIHLEIGEPNVDTPLYIQEAAIEAIYNGYFHYTHNLGLLSLREAFTGYLKRTYDLDVDTQQVAVTPGAVAALAISMLAVVDSGEEVLIPDPSWPNYGQMIFSQGAIPVMYVLKPENNFQPMISDLEKTVTQKTKAIVINTPSNPTGAVIEKNKMIEILDFARRHDLYVISDEIYDGIVYDGEHCPAMSCDKEGRVIAIYGVSKNFAMTGWRIGFAVASRQITSVIEKTIEPLVSCASTVSQKAAEAAYNGHMGFMEKMRQTYKKRRDIVYEIFQKANVTAYRPQAAFYMLIDFSQTGLFPEEIAIRLLDEEKVAVGPGFTFGPSCRNMARISLATEEAALLEGTKRICHFINKYRGN